MANQGLSEGVSCPIPISAYPTILLAHGGGGRLSQQLIERMFLPQFDNTMLSRLHDGAVFDLGGARVAFSTDSYVVKPVFFPGGNIGELAVNGTVNDISMCGARPLYLSTALIIEEGFAMGDLWRVVQSMREAAARAGVLLVTGDTKVVDRGSGDGIFVTTSGIGLVAPGVSISPERARPGDRVLLSGTIADHGIAIMSLREGLSFETTVQSDTTALNHLVMRMLDVCPDIHVLRDPTRGGVASALNEIAAKASVGIRINESRIPVHDEVRGACEILGLDPLYVANEGKLLALVPPDAADRVLEVMTADPIGSRSAVIGEVTGEHPGIVTMATLVGGHRVVDMMSGEQLPRIC